MHSFTVQSVQVDPADSGFLLDDGNTAILCDSGFGFTGERMADRIEAALKGRQLDFIFLTHSHYDHVLGSLNVARRFPNAKIVAGSYAAKIFAKPSARELMHKLDSGYAKEKGIEDYEDLTDRLRVDIMVEEGDELKTGDKTWRVLSLPGHTKCSVGFYCVEDDLLIGVESLGVYGTGDVVMPSYLVGFQMVLDSIRKVRELSPTHILIPHYGVISDEECSCFLELAEQNAVETAKQIVQKGKEGAREEDLIDILRKKYYTGYVKTIYPEAAFLLNAGITVRLLLREDTQL